MAFVAPQAAETALAPPGMGYPPAVGLQPAAGVGADAAQAIVMQQVEMTAALSVPTGAAPVSTEAIAESTG